MKEDLRVKEQGNCILAKNCTESGSQENCHTSQGHPVENRIKKMYNPDKYDRKPNMVDCIINVGTRPIDTKGVNKVSTVLTGIKVEQLSGNCRERLCR